MILLILYNPKWISTFPFHAQTAQDLGIIAEITRATEMPSTLAATAVDGPAPTMDGTRGAIQTTAARMSGVMAAMARIRQEMDVAINDWQNELRHADDDEEYEGMRAPPPRYGGGSGWGPPRYDGPPPTQGYGRPSGPPPGAPPGAGRMGPPGGPPPNAGRRSWEGEGRGWAADPFAAGRGPPQGRPGTAPVGGGAPPPNWGADRGQPYDARGGGGVGGGPGWDPNRNRGPPQGAPPQGYEQRFDHGGPSQDGGGGHRGGPEGQYGDSR